MKWPVAVLVRDVMPVVGRLPGVTSVRPRRWSRQSLRVEKWAQVAAVEPRWTLPQTDQILINKTYAERAGSGPWDLFWQRVCFTSLGTNFTTQTLMYLACRRDENLANKWRFCSMEVWTVVLISTLMVSSCIAEAPRAELVMCPDVNVKLNNRGATVKVTTPDVTTSYFSDGSILASSRYRAGKLDGVSLLYHSNGHLAERASYKGGLRDGEWTAWSSNGQLIRKAQFSADQLVSGEWPAKKD